METIQSTKRVGEVKEAIITFSIDGEWTTEDFEVFFRTIESLKNYFIVKPYDPSLLLTREEISTDIESYKNFEPLGFTKISYNSPGIIEVIANSTVIVNFIFATVFAYIEILNKYSKYKKTTLENKLLETEVIERQLELYDKFHEKELRKKGFGRIENKIAYERRFREMTFNLESFVKLIASRGKINDIKTNTKKPKQ